MATPPEWPRAGSSWCLWAAHTCWIHGAAAAPRAELGVKSKSLAQGSGGDLRQPCSTAPCAPAPASHPQHHLHTLSIAFTPAVQPQFVTRTLGNNQLSSCSWSWVCRNRPAPSETRDPQIRSLVPHCSPKRRNSWYKPSFNPSSHQSTSTASTHFHRQRGLLTVFCYLIRPEHFKRKQLPKDWPSSHGRDNPTWAGSPSPDSTAPVIPVPPSTSKHPRDPASQQQRGCNTSTTQTPSFAPHFFSVFHFPELTLKAPYTFTEKHGAIVLILTEFIKSKAGYEISLGQQSSWYCFLKKQEKLRETQQPEGSTGDAQGELLHHNIRDKWYRNVTIHTCLTQLSKSNTYRGKFPNAKICLA